MNDELARLEDLKLQEELISKGSHAVKSPLTSLITGIQFLANSKEDISPKLWEILHTLEKSTFGLKNLVMDIFNALKIICDMKTNDISRVNIRFEVDKAKSMINLKPEQQLDVNVNLKNDEIFYQTRVVEIITRSLLENASIYSTDGTTISLNVDIVENYLRIIVADEGTGINDQDVEKICEPFYRSAMHKTSRIEGTGLGLTIVKSIVNKLEGNLKINSKRGEGSTFTVTLPLLIDQ